MCFVFNAKISRMGKRLLVAIPKAAELQVETMGFLDGADFRVTLQKLPEIPPARSNEV